MLKLVCGLDRLQNSAELIRRICEEAKNGHGGQILIVPEQYSHEAERSLCAAGGDTISRYAEVLSFSRLAARVFSLYGGVCDGYLDKGGRLLTIYLAVEQVQSQLKYYASVSRKPEFLQRLGAMMEELMGYCTQPQQLQEIAGRLEGSFAQKLTELGLIYESYLSVCKTGERDPITRLTRLSELLMEEDYAEDKCFYLDGFSDFTAVEMQIVTALMKRGMEVTIALTTDGSEKPPLHTAAQTLRLLKKEAARYNETVRKETAGAEAVRAKEMSAWLLSLFCGADAPQNAGKKIELHDAGSVRQECESAAARIRQLVSGGCRYRDIGIAVTDRAVYYPELMAVLERAGIPGYYAGNAEILQKPLFAALLAAMDAVDRYEYEPLMHYLKSGLTPLTPEACDRLEQYAYFWNIHGKTWTQEWTMHPDGYGRPWDEESRDRLAQLNLWRETVIAPLQKLRTSWMRAENVSKQLTALLIFLEEIELQQTLQEQTRLLSESGRPQQAQETEQLYETLISAIVQMNRILGSCVMQPDSFCQIFRMLLSQYQVGTIPASIDEILIGELDSFRHKSIENLLILGAEEEKLPAFSLPLGILTDEERIRLLSMGLELSPAQEEKLDREMGHIFAAFSAATERIYMSCCAEQPSWLLLKTKNLFPDAVVTRADSILPITDLNSAAAQLAQCPEQDEKITSPVLLQCIYELRRKSGYQFEPLEKETVQGMYGKEIRLSASKIDRFASCRYAFFLNYGLKLRPWQQARFDAPIFGTFVHYILEKTVQDVQKAGGFAKVEESALLKIAEDHIRTYTETFMPEMEKNGERFAYLFRRNKQEVLSVVADVGREMRLSEFEPGDTELAFDDQNGLMPSVHVRGKLGESSITGFVDRVDLFRLNDRTYYRVVDYKTGTKSFDYTDLLHGEGLQMLIYLFALRQNGKEHYGSDIHPAGVLYVPAKCSMERVDVGADAQTREDAHRKTHRRSGLLLDDDLLLQAMEKGNTPEYLPYQVKKTGKSGNLAAPEQMQKLEQFVMQSIADLTDQMLGGVVQPNPIIRGPEQSACRYCDFRQTCHKDACSHDRRYRKTVKAEEFWEELERRQNNG